MRGCIREFAFALGLVASVAGHSEEKLTCDMVALANTSNEALETQVARVLGNKRVQCGIPGEVLRVCRSCAEATAEDSMHILRPILAVDGHVAWHTAWH